MYKKHNTWDEDKWNIHSSGNSHSSGSGAGYAGRSSDNPMESYHKSQIYSSNAGKEDQLKDFYRSNEQQEEDKKKKEQGKEKTLADAVQQEEKYQKKQDQIVDNENPTGFSRFESARTNESTKSAQQSSKQSSQGEIKKGENSKKENKKSIEEAISDAIKEEKEVIHLD